MSRTVCKRRQRSSSVANVEYGLTGRCLVCVSERKQSSTYLVVEGLGLEASSVPDTPLGVQGEDLEEQLGLAGELSQVGARDLSKSCVVGDEESELVLLDEAGESLEQA